MDVLRIYIALLYYDPADKFSEQGDVMVMFIFFRDYQFFKRGIIQCHSKYPGKKIQQAHDEHLPWYV